jgi:hypothetical protein
MSTIRTFGRRTQETILRVVLETCPLGSGLQQVFNLNDPDITLESAFAIIQSIQIEVPNLPDANTEYKNLIIVLPNFTTLGVVKTFLLRTRLFLLRTRLFYNHGLTTNGGGLPLSIPVTFRVGSNDSPTNVVLGQTSVATVNLDGSVSVSAIGGSPTNLATVATTGSYADLIDVPATFPPTPHTHLVSQITGLAAVATSGSYNDLANVPTAFPPAAHTHPASEITGLATVATSGDFSDLIGLPPILKTAARRMSDVVEFVDDDWHSVPFDVDVGTDEIGLIWSDSNRTFAVPAGISKIRITASFEFSFFQSFFYTFAKNGAALTGGDAWSSFYGNSIKERAAFSPAYGPTIQTAWIPVVAGDYFRVIVRRMNGLQPESILNNDFTFLTVEAY